MQILIIDIETRPNLAYVWGLWNQNIGLNQISETGQVISFAAKWHGSKNVIFKSDFHDGHEAMVQSAWELLDKADAVVHYNGKAFDIKHLNREFVVAHMPPPSPHADIDLLSTVKKSFKFPSNKLQHVATQLELGSKVQHDGFDLWLACMNNEEKAWNIMRRYNKQDVVLTEQLYDELLPWIKPHPNRALANNQALACTRCASTSFHKRGFMHTNSAVYQRYCCNSCHGFFRSRKAEPTRTESRV